MDFLHNRIHKELFTFLSSKVVEFNWPPATAVYVTSGKAAASIGFTTPCKTAIMKRQTPVVHALEQEAKTIQVHTVDTDIVVILAGTFYDLIVTQPLIDIWVAFVLGRQYRFYHINAICASLGEQQS